MSLRSQFKHSKVLIHPLILNTYTQTDCASDLKKKSKEERFLVFELLLH